MSTIYIDQEQHRIFIDNSTRTIFEQCKEKARLYNVMGYRMKGKVGDIALDFGHAFHAAIAAYYDAKAGGYYDINMNWHMFDTEFDPVKVAQEEFMADCMQQGSTLPIEVESAERRSLERGIMLVEAYANVWEHEPYDNILDSEGRPLTEIYFEIPVARWGEWDIMYCGTIDRLMINGMTRRPVIFETKTTTKSINLFLEERKPNAQVTGYFPIAWKYMEQYHPELSPITEAVWDATFISKRMPNMNKALRERFWTWGIKTKDDNDGPSDFKRQITQRSKTDVQEFMIDLEESAVQFAKWLMSNAPRWPRTTTSTTCHLFNGCPFRMACSVNDNQPVLDTMYEVRPWNPRMRLRQLS